MKNFHRIAFVFALALVSLTPRLSEADSLSSFKATIAITESIQFIGAPPCFLEGNISGTGQAAKLGKVTIASQDCINPITESLFSFFSTNVTFTTTTGDQIFAAYSGTFSVNDNVGTITGAYLIIGGTGRFVRAAGAGVVNGQEDMLTGQGQVQLLGTISY